MSEIISLINEKGGVGKSSSAISIAQILAISGYSILLIDLDPQMNTSKMFGKNDEGNAKDYEQLFCKKLSKKSEVLDYISQTDYENISILCASRVLNSLIYKIYDESKESNVELCFKYNLALLKDDYDFMVHGDVAMEVVPKGYSKASGIAFVCEKLGIDVKDTYAFGDSANDVDMLEFAGVGVAMGDGTDVAKEHADYVTRGLHEDGIYHALKHFALI